MDSRGGMPLRRDVPHHILDYSTSEVFHVSITFSSVNGRPLVLMLTHPGYQMEVDFQLESLYVATKVMEYRLLHRVGHTYDPFRW